MVDCHDSRSHCTPSRTKLKRNTDEKRKRDEATVENEIERNRISYFISIFRQVQHFIGDFFLLHFVLKSISTVEIWAQRLSNIIRFCVSASLSQCVGIKMIQKFSRNLWPRISDANRGKWYEKSIETSTDIKSKCNCNILSQITFDRQ